MNVDEKLDFVLGRVENIVGKGVVNLYRACIHQPFLRTVFKKSCSPSFPYFQAVKAKQLLTGQSEIVLLPNLQNLIKRKLKLSLYVT